MSRLQRIAPCLWFDDQAEAAVAFYTSVFPHSRTLFVSHYGEAGQALHGRVPGSVMSIGFELDGQAMTALNGGPVFQFNEAISLQVNCQDQAEIDHFWAALGEGGDASVQQCGWLKDRYGLAWQIVPAELSLLLTGDAAAAQRVMQALLGMRRLDLAALRRAHDAG
ncbi:MAG: hypothetical protein GAK43_01469 [Stenotrophomonas maltophilia]|nr:MAG: hypothetical protein GAK43_01469 [Stenotrophomonas maltophilia]